MKKVYLYPCADSYLLYQYAQNAHDTFIAVEDTDTDTDWINDAEGYVIGNPKLSKINKKLTVFPTYAPSAKDKAMANYVYSYYRTPVFSFLVNIGSDGLEEVEKAIGKDNIKEMLAKAKIMAKGLQTDRMKEWVTPHVGYEDNNYWDYMDITSYLELVQFTDSSLSIEDKAVKNYSQERNNYTERKALQARNNAIKAYGLDIQIINADKDMYIVACKILSNLADVAIVHKDGFTIISAKNNDILKTIMQALDIENEPVNPVNHSVSIFLNVPDSVYLAIHKGVENE